MMESDFKILCKNYDWEKIKSRALKQNKIYKNLYEKNDKEFFDLVILSEKINQKQKEYGYQFYTHKKMFKIINELEKKNEELENRIKDLGSKH